MDIRNYQEYIFQCDWYNEWDDKEIHTCGLIMAPSMHDAVEAIEQRLPYCNHLTINEYDERQFIWISQAHYNRLIQEGNEYMFEEDEPMGDEDENPDLRKNSMKNEESPF